MRILIVDDDEHIRNSLTIGLQLQWPESQVVAAPDGEAGLRLFHEREPTIAILDLALPGMSGFEVLQQIRRVSDAPVIILTARGEELDQVRGLELGADDYVVKPFGHLALVARIRAVLRRADVGASRALPDVVAGDLTISFGARRVTKRGQPVKLTPVEFKLLQHLVQNADRLVPHDVLLSRIFGDEHGATSDYLKVFVSRLRGKIESKEGPRYIETERGVGYRFVRPAAEG